MATIVSTTLDSEGCNQASAGETGIVVLDFGQPQTVTLDSSAIYGTLIFDYVTFVDTYTVASAAKNYLAGYWRCRTADSPGIILAIGLNNYHGETTYNHGRAWAAVVNDVDAWIHLGTDYAPTLTVAAAMNIEQSYNSPINTSNWISGYSSLTSRPLYNFGNCAGCNCPTTNCALSNGWTQEDVWWVSWGSLYAFPLPEIYNTTGANATQWLNLSLYSVNVHTYPMRSQGAFTQWQACIDRSQPPECTGTNNAPSIGWTQLYSALNSTITTAQSLPWSTDITWQN